MNQSRFSKWSLIFGIVIVSNLFINYALSLAYKEPSYDQFCPSQQVIEAVATKDQCVAQGGQWNGNVTEKGYCDLNYTCGNQYNDARIAYERNVFIVLILAGVILIAAGLFVGANGVVRTSLSLSGALSLVIGSIRYWGEAHDWLKVVILGVALAALITLAVKKFSEKVRPQ